MQRMGTMSNSINYIPNSPVSAACHCSSFLSLLRSYLAVSTKKVHLLKHFSELADAWTQTSARKLPALRVQMRGDEPAMLHISEGGCCNSGKPACQHLQKNRPLHKGGWGRGEVEMWENNWLFSQSIETTPLTSWGWEQSVDWPVYIFMNVREERPRRKRWRCLSCAKLRMESEESLLPLPCSGATRQPQTDGVTASAL